MSEGMIMQFVFGLILGIGLYLTYRAFFSKNKGTELSHKEMTEIIEKIHAAKESSEMCKTCGLLAEQCSWMLRQSDQDRALISMYWASTGLPGNIIIQWAMSHDLKPSEFINIPLSESNRIKGFANHVQK